MKNRCNLIYFGIIILLIVMILCSCGKTKINSAEDEIKLYSWSYNENDIDAKLSFDNNTAVLELKSSGEECKISGVCVFTESVFVICDEEISENFLFEYNFSGNNLEILYNENTLCFKKDT